MSRKLEYFNLNGFAESIRYILHYGGLKFEDVRYDYRSWPIMEVKERLPYGQLPVYEENGKVLNQSIAIARYVASQVHLLPSEPWDQAVLDAAVLTIYDFWTKVEAYIEEEKPAKKQEMKNEIFNETVDFVFPRFEKVLKNNNGHFWTKLCWADFVLVGILEAANLFLEQDIDLHKYPTIKALCDEIRSLPGVKEYIAKRKPYVWPMHCVMVLFSGL